MNNFEDDHGRIKVKFELTNEFGSRYATEADAQVFYSLNESELDVIFRHFNIFLMQCGYSRKNDYIFAEDITEEEYDLLWEYLQELRSKKDETRQ